MTNIPKDSIIKKCKDIHETIVKFKEKLNKINVLTAGVFTKSDPIKFKKFESMTKTFLPINSNWKQLNLKKEIKNNYNAAPSLGPNCVLEITVDK